MEHPCHSGPDRLPCRRVRLGQAFDLNLDCHLCWKFAHDKQYNLGWGGDGNVTEAPRTSTATTNNNYTHRLQHPCRHLGGPTGTTVDCRICGGAMQSLPLYYCALHHECLLNKAAAGKPSCLVCPDYSEVHKVKIVFNHGLGDAVAFTSVLKHIKKHHSQWHIDLYSNPNYRILFHDLVQKVFPLDDQTHHDYDLTWNVAWREGIGNHDNLPSTKTIRCLLEEFHIQPEFDLLRYTFTPSAEDHRQVDDYLKNLTATKGFVAIHGQGNSCAESKNIPQPVVDHLCNFLISNDYTPILLDFTKSVGFLAALLQKTVLNILIDSGPQKLALTTQTPLLCVWLKSHPFHYIDDPDYPTRMVHLIPTNYREYLAHSNGIDRQCGIAQAVEYSKNNHRCYIYKDLLDGLTEMAGYLLGFGNAKPLAAVKPRRRRLKLHTGLPPGDVLTLTATVQMLHDQYPNQYITGISTDHPEIWEHNPHVVPWDDSFEHVEMQYSLINESGHRPVHFIQGYTEFLGNYLKIPLQTLTNRPHLYLLPEEINWMNQCWETTGNPGAYWVINSGVKRDYTTKQYPFYQEVVDLLKHRVRFVQIGKSTDMHTPLHGVVNLIDKTSIRALIRLIYHAQGVVCGTTFLMHLAAAFNKPAVIIAGGREPRLWNSYPCQTLLATVGALPCCRDSGCWRSRVIPLGDEKEGEKFCERPMPTTPPAGECMTRISPELVVKAIESYL